MKKYKQCLLFFSACSEAVLLRMHKTVQLIVSGFSDTDIYTGGRTPLIPMLLIHSS